MSDRVQRPLRYGEDYQTIFSIPDYMVRSYTMIGEEDSVDDVLRMLNRKWIETFASGTIKGKRLLDFGCGPSILISIPSSRCFDEIYMCDYAAQNRQAVQDWIDEKPSALNWMPFLKFTAEKEGKGVQKPLRYGEDYQTIFSIPDYMVGSYSMLGKEDDNVLRIQRNMLNRKWIETFASGTIKGKRLLDFGCGPSLLICIPASRCFDEIYMCDYAAQNRQAVQDWIDEKTSAHDWTPFLKFTAEKEGKGITHQEVASRVRQKIQKIFVCNILSVKPFEPVHLVGEFFDCITTNLCLESACLTEDEYKLSVKKLASYLKPGGHIFMGCSLNSTYYQVGDELFYDLPLCPELVKAALREAGIIDVELSELRSDLPEGYVARFFFAKGVKPSEMD